MGFEGYKQSALHHLKEGELLAQSLQALARDRKAAGQSADQAEHLLRITLKTLDRLKTIGR